MRSIGVVGIGYWGKNYLRGLLGLGDVEVVGVDPDPDRRAEVHRAFPAVRMVSSMEEALPMLDAAIICTPPHSHRALAITAMNAGVHVLIEKPMATSESDCRAIESVALSTGMTLMVGHTYDYNDVVDDMTRRVRTGELGEIRYLDSARLSVGGYRSDVNVMWDMAPHDIVIMRRLANAWPTRVSAWAVDHSGSRKADVATLRLDFEDQDIVGYVRVSWLDPFKVRRFSIVGSEKMAIFNESDPDIAPLRIVDSGREKRLGVGSVHPLPPGYGSELVSEPMIQQREPLGRQLDEFLRCVRTGGRPRTDGYEGRRVVQVLEAADLSAVTGQTIAMPAMGEKLRV